MGTIGKINDTMTKYRWTICSLLFFATTINYLDRQVLSLLQPTLAEEFHWTDSDYGTITSIFSLAYAIFMLFAGRFIDFMGTRKGYTWAIVIWSIGAMIHATCGILTERMTGLENADALRSVTDPAIIASIASFSVVMFVLARIVLALGEAGNFPAAIKATAEYFPKRDRAFATGIFNSGANIGAILAPLTVPFMAKAWGWEMAFIVVGAVGFVWMGAWLLLYRPLENNRKVNDAERAYILQDNVQAHKEDNDNGTKMSFWQCFKYKQTWSFAFGKFMTDGVWWFFLFWTPAYLKAEYGMGNEDIAIPIGVLYTLTVFGSVFGGKFPTYFINKGMNPYAGRMRAMLIIAFCPLVVLLAQPFGHMEFLGNAGYWIPVLLIGIGGSAHQAWSANIFSTIGDMFPKKAIATVTGIGGMAGGVGSFFINKGSGILFDYSDKAWQSYDILGASGKSIGYLIVFSGCAVAYLIGWSVMKTLVPKYKPIEA
ncbi:MAG: MFS transporter [Bacteroidales bacterium]|nr:MFS transporter [Bacteroidales bacterium]